MCCLSAGRLPPYASHPPGRCLEVLYMTVNCPKRARPCLGSHKASLLQDPAGQSKPQTSPNSRGGKNSKPNCQCGTGRLLGNHECYNPLQGGKRYYSAHVHTLSASPLNSKAFDEFKILLTFVPRVAIPIVLSTVGI